MIRNNNLRFEFLTKGQQVMFDAFGHCIKYKKMIFLLDNSGSGFSYTLAKAFREKTFESVRVITVQVVPSIEMSNIILKMYQQTCTVKFSNLNRKNIDPHELLVKIGSKLRQELLGKRIMIVFNHVHLIRSMYRMHALVKLLLSIPFECGVILRTTNTHFKAIIENQELPELFPTIRTKFEIKTVPKVSREDVISLCHANGLMDKILIDELVAKSKNLKLVQYYLSKEKELSPYTQLSLFN